MSDQDKPKGIPSPFSVPAMVVNKATNSGDIADTMATGFARLLAVLEAQNANVDKYTMTIYLAGFTASLKALGFDQAEGMALTKQVAEHIIKIGTEGDDEPCDCPNCKGKK